MALKIFQSRNGAVHLLNGYSKTILTYTQLIELQFDVYSLADFDYEDFKKYYKLNEYAEPVSA